MTAPLVIVTGTGTGIGKTVVASALVVAWGRRGLAVAGVKPIESGQSVEQPTALGTAPRAELGVGAEPTGDVAELGKVSTFHVTRFPPPYLFASPVSPHLAARREGREIDLSVVVDWVAPIRAAADAVVLELPGGLFSPLTDAATNATLVRALSPSKVVIVAPDRLGVLHDLIATTRAARSEGIGLDGLILSAPAALDASTGTNAAELSRTLPEVPVLAVFARAPLHRLLPDADRALDVLAL